MNYRYWIVRYVPNIARGEFTNIGISCGADDGDWSVEFDTRGVPGSGALRADLRELGPWVCWFTGRMNAFSSASFDSPSVSSGRLEHLRRRQANAVQLSSPVPIEAESAAAAVQLLFPHLIQRERVQRHRGGLTRRRMRSDVRDLFHYERELLPGKTLFTQPKMVVGRQRGGFDLGRDEAIGTVLTNTWVFNVVSLENLERDVQSWNYLVSRFRGGGGSVLFGDHERHLAGTERVEVVYDPPQAPSESSWRSDIFGAAQEAWQLGGSLLRLSTIMFGGFILVLSLCRKTYTERRRRHFSHHPVALSGWLSGRSS